MVRVTVADANRALIGIMIFTFARVGAVVQMNVCDYFGQGGRRWVRLHGKGGKEHEAFEPLGHPLENADAAVPHCCEPGTVGLLSLTTGAARQGEQGGEG